jgi:hypothetical protein
MDVYCVLCEGNSEHFASKRIRKEKCEIVNDDNISVCKVITEIFVCVNNECDTRLP